MGHRVVKGVMAVLAVSVAACSGSQAPPAAGSAGGAGRVFFVQPKNGDTIKTLSTIEFGSQGVTVAAVPPGELKPEQVRPGMIHYHLGTDTDCLPAGTVIPKAAPWVHFGDGKNVIEMSMTPGPHKVVLQSGDDMHRTIEGLCETINVTVAP
jgi:hypothetical protein